MTNPLCKYCNSAPVALSKSGTPKQYCSMSCQSKHTNEKRKQTNLDRYGTENPMLLQSIKEKRTATNIQKYGVPNPFVLQEISQKYKNTCLERYGVEHASQSTEIQEKQRAAWHNYHNNHPFSDPDIREKRKTSMIEKYGVEHPIQNTDIKKKQEATCMNIYGTSNPASAQHVRDKIANTLTDGASVFLADEQWLVDNIAAHGIRGVAESLSVSLRCVRQYADKYQIDFRSSKSTFEDQVVLFIQTEFPNLVILRNDKATIGKELDIVIPEKNIAIECNGSYWHSETNGRGKQYHLAKTKLCNDLGFHLLHIWEHDWLTKREIICSRIRSSLGGSEVRYARKFMVGPVSAKASTEFMRDNHLQGACASSIRYGLVDETGKLWSMMTFGKARFTNEAEYELIRFASALNCNIVGAASKLFARFIRDYQPKSVISYSDKSFNTGKVYEILGFAHTHESAPSYRYTVDYTTFENRVKYQKHKLATILPVFDPAATEWENMKANGYDRIWDCGTDVWMFTAYASQA